jgi:hypothetical protein
VRSISAHRRVRGVWWPWICFIGSCAGASFARPVTIAARFAPTIFVSKSLWHVCLRLGAPVVQARDVERLARVADVVRHRARGAEGGGDAATAGARLSTIAR